MGTLSDVPSGQSVSLRMLLDGLVDRGIPHRLVDLAADPSRSRVDGTFSWRRVGDILGRLPDYLVGLVQGRPTVYLLMGQSVVGFLRDVCFIWPAWFLGRRVVVHLKGGNFHRFYEEQPRWLQMAIRLTLARTDTVIVLSERLKKCFAPVLPSPGKMAVVPNGLPMKGSREDETAELGEESPLRILYLSNMIESKGYWELLDACRLLDDRGLDFHCRFCGNFGTSRDDRRFDSPSEAREAFLTRIDELDLGDRVRWLGIVRGDEKRDVLRWAHCMVLPTRYINEGQPVSLIEGMAFGAVLIATEYRAIPDLIRDGVNGFLLHDSSPVELADRLEWLGRHREAVSDMSGASLELFRSRYSRERHLDQLLSVLLEPNRA